MKKSSRNKLLALGTLLLGLGLLSPAYAVDLASDTTDVEVTTDLYYNMTASGTAQLQISDANYNSIGEYNFINKGISVAVAVNTAWRIKAQLDQNMPTTPGGGYTLRVDDNRGQG